MTIVPSRTTPSEDPESRVSMIPPASFTKHLPSYTLPTRRVPQAVSHRGYKARYPENTMAAFEGAVAVGSHGLETDLRLSSDGQVVLSHDRSLKRCFGVDRNVGECDWSYLSMLRTLRAPHEPMPRLVDLLRWLGGSPPKHSDGEDAEAEPETQTAAPEEGEEIVKRRKTWLLLDVKTDDDPETLIQALAKAVKSVERSDGVPWHERIVVGCWSQAFMHATLAHLPDFHISHISFSPINSKRFLRSPAYPGLSFNMLQQSLVGPLGSHFIRAVRSQPDADLRRLFVWTVNEVYWMRWSIKHGMDAVVTDDPAKYLDVVRRLEAEAGAQGGEETGMKPTETDEEDPSRPSVYDDPGIRTSWGHKGKLYLQATLIQVITVMLLPWLYRHVRWRYHEPGRRKTQVA